MRKKHITIANQFSPTYRPGREILLRSGEYSPSQIVRRDLARYYDLVSSTVKGMKGEFKLEELEALANAVRGMDDAERAELTYQAPMLIQKAVNFGQICAEYGIEECDKFMDKIERLNPVDFYALVDSIERYLANKKEGGGVEEGWKKVGLI